MYRLRAVTIAGTEIIGGPEELTPTEVEAQLALLRESVGSDSGWVEIPLNPDGDCAVIPSRRVDVAYFELVP